MFGIKDDPVVEGAAPARAPFFSRRPLGMPILTWLTVPLVAFLVGWIAIVASSPAAASLPIASDPPGATVLLDGAAAGTTPLELRHLRPGRSYTLRLEAQGYKPLDRTFVAERDAAPWAVALEPVADPLLDQAIVRELVGQIGESGHESLYAHELAETLFTVNPLIEQNPWLTERTWGEIFQTVVQTNFGGDSTEFVKHLRAYNAELAAGATSKLAWYQHLHECEKICRPVVTEVFKRHIEWLRHSGFTMIYFPLDQDRLDEQDIETIGRFVAEHGLQTNLKRQVLLVGRASQIGGQQYNLELSARRGDSVARELASRLPDGAARLRRVHLGFEPPVLTASVAEFLRLDPALSDTDRNQSVMVILSEPLLPGTRSSNDATP